MNIKIIIDNEEVLCDKNLIIKEEMLNASSVILNNVFPKSWENEKDYVSNFYYPKDYSKCKIIENPGEQNEKLLFCGVVKNTGNINLNPRYPHYCNLQILDFKTLLSEGETLDYVIVDKTVSQAIAQVVESVSDYGFVVGNIQIANDDVIGAYSTKDKTPYDVFQYFADITQSRWYTRMIDENTIAIDFYDPELLPSGQNFDYKLIDCSIINIDYNYSTNDYRNKQIMTSNEVISNIKTYDTLTANGYQKQFTLSNKIGSIDSITINGETARIITNEQKELGFTGDFYYTPGNNYIESDTILSSGSLIFVEYYAIIEGRQVLVNPFEINRIHNQINRKGIISRYENRNDATTTNELVQIGLSYLQFKGSPEITLKIQTKNNDLWNIGQVVNTYNFPIEDLNTNYMVKAKETQMIISTGDIFYTYELTSNYNSENKINYFDNQRAKANGNIGQGEYISKNIDIQNNANVVFYDLTVTEVTIDGNNILNSGLNSPLNN
jgi:hypothetical protein